MFKLKFQVKDLLWITAYVAVVAWFISLGLPLGEVGVSAPGEGRKKSGAYRPHVDVISAERNTTFDRSGVSL